jgi:apolipoprotein D and lipocalin family protein
LGLIIFNSYSVRIPRGAFAERILILKNIWADGMKLPVSIYRFEKNMDNVTAEYTENPDGTVQVRNKGYDYVKKYGMNLSERQNL